MDTVQESLLINGGKNVLDKLLKFIDSVIILNTQEFLAYETEESYNNHVKYTDCKAKRTTFNDHIFEEDDPILGTLKNMPNSTRNSLLKKGDPNALFAIDNLRNSFIDSYSDKNKYCCMLSGVPYNKDTYIYVVDRDRDEYDTYDITYLVQRMGEVYDPNITLYISDILYDSFPKTYTYLFINGGLEIEPNLPPVKKIPLHKVSPKIHPKTYNNLYVDGYINIILEKVKNNRSYDYVKYINKHISTDTIRNGSNFDILWVDKTILDSTDLEYFYMEYYKMRDYVIYNKYISKLEEIYDVYANLNCMIILFATFQRMCISILDKYSVRNYTDKDIYDILDSNNLSVLRSVKMKTLRNIVENLDKLLSERGTEKVLGTLLKIISKDEIIGVKRYDILKKYRESSDGVLELHRDKAYNDPENVDLVFIDTVKYTNSDTIKVGTASRQIIPYYDFVVNDPTWGAHSLYKDPQSRINSVKKLKEDILKIPFNKLSTKYLGVTILVDIFDMSSAWFHKMSLMLQYYKGFSHVIKNVEVDFDTVKCNPFELLVASIFGFKYLEKLRLGNDTYDIIDDWSYTLEQCMRLNTIPREDTLSILKSLSFIPDRLTNRVFVGDVLSDEEINKYMIVFSNDGNFDTIINEFSDPDGKGGNYAIYKELGILANSSNEYNVAMSWKCIYDFFTININYKDDYKNCTMYSDFIQTYNGSLYNKIEENILSVTHSNNYEKVVVYATKLINAFKNSISPLIREEIDNTDVQQSIKTSVDLDLLIKTFVSIYVELRDIDIYIDMSDIPNNRIQFMDRYSMNTTMGIQDTFTISHEFSILEFSRFSDTLEFEHIQKSIDSNIFSDSLEFIHKKYINQTNRTQDRFNIYDMYDDESIIVIEEDDNIGFIFREDFKIIDL